MANFDGETHHSDREKEVLSVVERVWGYSALRPMQREAIGAGLEGRDSLVVLPTGGGKSLCYQVPALVAGRLDVVVSPLISLMKDQVDGLRSNGYPAAAIHSGLNGRERDEVFQEVRDGGLRLLFVSPERLMNGGFAEFLRSAGVSNFAIDEAHCISHWGHDFRPEYRRLAELRRWFPKASFHAFTATATERVRGDIVKQLGLKDPCLLVGYFDRPNLVYRVVPRVDMERQVLEVIERHEGEAVIVYCISRKETERLADYLNDHGVDAKAYHAGKSAGERKRVQDAFSRERLDVVTATVAFGMGIDRSNVRCVIHAAMPKSVEHYQQETGRAGRDGLEAECVLLYSQSDVIRWERLIAMSAEEADDPDELIKAGKALLRGVQRFASGTECRHRSLVEYFGQEYNEKGLCGACDVCLKEVDVIEDSTTIAQKIISCVARVEQRFGVGHVADVLTGSKAEMVRRNGHDQLSVHGLLSSMPKKAVVNLTHQLIDQNWLSRTEGDRPLVVLNERSRLVLRREREVKLVRPSGKLTLVKVDTESWEGVERGLFEELRRVRRDIAEERRVPAFVIFSDATLRDMARRRPSAVEGMLDVYGIGEKKANDFGVLFLQTICDYCKDNEVEMDAVHDGGKRKRHREVREAGGAGGAGGAGEVPAWKEAIFDRFRNGVNVESIMSITGRALSTVMGYLTDYIKRERPVDVSPWVDDEVYARVEKVITDVGLEKLRPIYEALDGEVEWEPIKIVVAHLRAWAECEDEKAGEVLIARISNDNVIAK